MDQSHNLNPFTPGLRKKLVVKRRKKVVEQKRLTQFFPIVDLKKRKSSHDDQVDEDRDRPNP